MGILDLDSEFMQAVGKIADYIILNLLCVLFSLPIVTMGAAMTAKFYVAMKMTRGEEPKVSQAFIKSFRENFKQVTKIWIVIVLIGAVVAWDWYSILYGKSQGMFLYGKIAFLVMTILFWSVAYNLCAFLARFHMTTKEAIKGSLVFTFLNLPKMVLILLVTVLSYIIEAWYLEWALAIWLFFTTVTLYYVSKMYVKQFAKIEGQ